MSYPVAPPYDFDALLRMLAYSTGKDGNATPSQPDFYQYFWSDHPEKNKTVMSRYESFGAEAQPLYGEIGHESSGYSGAQPNFPMPGAPPGVPGNPMMDQLNRMPGQWRKKYMHMLGQVRPDFKGETSGSWGNGMGR